MAKHPAVKEGAARKVKITATVWQCRCVKCGYAWQTSADEPPAYCAGCHSAEWWIKRPRGRPPKNPKA